MTQDSIWAGIYDRFDQVPSGTGLFDTDLWTSKQKERAAAILAGLQTKSVIPDAAKSRDYPLAAFLAPMLQQKKNVYMLDYGGAMGQTYLDLLSKLPQAERRLQCRVVETPEVVATIPPELSQLPGLSFASSAEDYTADVLHCGSVLQYIENWEAKLNELIAACDPSVIVLSDMLVGEIPTFVTAQHYGDRIIPVKFNNIERFMAYWDKTPYELVYRSYFYPLPGDEYFASHALPETHRLKKAAHFIFCKRKGE